MRKPSIHITEDELSNILHTLGVPRSVSLAKNILKMGKKYSLTNRKMLATTKKDTEKVQKITGSSVADTMEMGNIIFRFRKSMKHRGITPIKAGTSQYTVLKTITKLAMEFFTSYEHQFTSTNEAFLKYITLANSLMAKNFNITRIPSLNEKIIKLYDAEWKLREDKNPETTTRVYQNYILELIDRMGVVHDDPKDDPSEMVHFVDVAERCVDNNINPRAYILSQFEGLEWCNGIPTPAQLVGKNSWKYWQKYNLSNKDKDEPVINTNKVNKLKNILSNG